LAPVERFIGKRSLVGDEQFLPLERFPWVKHVEANWEIIREELEGVLEDREALLVGEPCMVREVEAQPVGRDVRALLADVVAQHVAKCGVQQVRRGVVPSGRLAAIAVDRGDRLLAGVARLSAKLIGPPSLWRRSGARRGRAAVRECLRSRARSRTE